MPKMTPAAPATSNFVGRAGKASGVSVIVICSVALVSIKM